MSSLDDFAESAARIVEYHGGGDGYTVTVLDPNATDDLETGGQTPDPREWTASCTKPTPYSPRMVTGGVQAGDASVWIAANDAAITFAPEPGMLATVNGPDLGDGVQFEIVLPTNHAGALELQLRDASGAPA